MHTPPAVAGKVVVHWARLVIPAQPVTGRSAWRRGRVRASASALAPRVAHRLRGTSSPVLLAASHRAHAHHVEATSVACGHALDQRQRHALVVVEAGIKIPGTHQALGQVGWPQKMHLIGHPALLGPAPGCALKPRLCRRLLIHRRSHALGLERGCGFNQGGVVFWRKARCHDMPGALGKRHKAVSGKRSRSIPLGMATQRSAGNPRAHQLLAHASDTPIGGRRAVSQPQRPLQAPRVVLARASCAPHAPAGVPGPAARRMGPTGARCVAMSHQNAGRHSSASARNAHIGGSMGPAGTTRTSRSWARRASTLVAAWCGACGAAPAPRPSPRCVPPGIGLPPPGWPGEPAGDEVHHPHGSPGGTLASAKLSAPRGPLRPPSGGTRCRSKGTLPSPVWATSSTPWDGCSTSFMPALGLGQNTAPWAFQVLARTSNNRLGHDQTLVSQ